jgi:pimeloyl-ACP methyl ester carboxylesterase
VIAYDRRGCTRSERPDPYDRTVVSEHADDAAALLQTLGATPAVVVGRYGGEVALDLAVRYPDRVRALALLEAPPMGLDTETDRWLTALNERIRTAALQDAHRVGEIFIKEVLGMWEELPEGLRTMFTENGPAILAECNGGDLVLEPETLERVTHPTLLVSASDSPEAIRRPMDVMASRMPGARVVRVSGGHLISPNEPDVLAFVREHTGRVAPAAGAD